MAEWYTMDSAPKDRTIEVRGRTNPDALRPRTHRVVWNKVRECWCNRGGWVVDAVLWREVDVP